MINDFNNKQIAFEFYGKYVFDILQTFIDILEKNQECHYFHMIH